MKRFILCFIGFLFLSIHDSGAVNLDSLIRRFHPGVSIYSGISQLVLFYPNYDYQIDDQLGLELGCIMSLKYQITNKYAARADYRIRKNMNSIFVTNFEADMRQGGIHLQRIFNNSSKQTLCEVSLGISYVKHDASITYKVDPRRIPPYPPYATVNYTHITESWNQDYTSFIFGISKSLLLHKRWSLNVFSEFEYGLQNLDMHDVRYLYDVIPSLNYRPASVRLGIGFMY